MSVEMTPCHLNHLISSTTALGMGGAQRLRRWTGAGARELPVHPKVRTPYKFVGPVANPDPNVPTSHTGARLLRSRAARRERGRAWSVFHARSLQ